MKKQNMTTTKGTTMQQQIEINERKKASKLLA